jgi:hypothetical protein
MKRNVMDKRTAGTGRVKNMVKSPWDISRD